MKNQIETLEKAIEVINGIFNPFNIDDNIYTQAINKDCNPLSAMSELRRIVEFLEEQQDTRHVQAISIQDKHDMRIYGFAMENGDWEYYSTTKQVNKDFIGAMHEKHGMEKAYHMVVESCERFK